MDITLTLNDSNPENATNNRKKIGNTAIFVKFGCAISVKAMMQYVTMNALNVALFKNSKASPDGFFPKKLN